jgi:hypothetical protein
MIFKFSGLDFGPDDAKGDARLPEYFVRTPEFEKVRAARARLLLAERAPGRPRYVK